MHLLLGSELPVVEAGVVDLRPATARHGLSSRSLPRLQSVKAWSRYVKTRPLL